MMELSAMLEFLLLEIRHYLQYGIFAALAVFAWVRGEAPEKLIALVFVAAISFEVVHRLYVHESPSQDLELAHTILDILMFAALAPIAMYANRIYPLCILAAQLIALVMHFERGILEEMSPLAYWVMIRIPSYFQMVAFATGLIAHHRRVRRGIIAPPWRRISPR